MAKKLFFGELEQAIMDVAWRQGPVTVRGVLDSLSRRSTAYTTVMTVMNRLAQQNLLQRKMGDDGAYVYHATSSRQTFYASAAKQRTQDMVKHYGDAALVQFLDAIDKIPEKKLAALKRQVKRQ
jgi:predicted transcriptional regulator